MLLLMSLSGCKAKNEMIKAEVIKVKVPDNFFYLKEIEANRSITSQKDIANLMLDLYGGYEECRSNLNAIKKWSDGL